MTVAELLDQARTLLGAASRIDAELLLAHALGRPRAWLYARSDTEVATDVETGYRSLIDARARGEPVAYLIGRREFWSLDLEVRPGVLIPRPDTERLVELALERIEPDTNARVADLGTGSGAIALAIARERPRAGVVATDASAEAVAIARANARRLGIGNVAFVEGDWCDALTAPPFDVIASNPPYVASDDPHLERGDLRFEPRAALASGSDGLDAIRRIVACTRAHLRCGGSLLIEHGFDQAARVRALLAANGFIDVRSDRDLGDHERVTSGRAP